MIKHIILIAPHQEMIDCALSYKLEITIIDKVENSRNYSILPNIKLFLYDYNDITLSKKLINSLNNVYPIDAIVTLTEKALRIAAELSIYLHLPTLPIKTINLIHNKNLMREFLSDKNGFEVKYSPVVNNDELLSFAENNGFPFIIKPVDGYGSKDVVKVSSYEQLKKINIYTELVAEEFLNGNEYSVECFTFNGQHIVIAITRKILIDSPDNSNFTEMGHCVPADLPEEKVYQIENYIKKFLTLIGINNGPSHTEIKVTENSIRIIETHNRIGGDRISSLVKISTGIDLVKLSILWPLGLCPPIINKICESCHAAIRFFNPPFGKLVSIIGIDTLKYSPSVIDTEITCKPGDKITPIKNSFNRYGFVITTGKSELDAIDNSVNAIDKIIFTVEPNID